MNKGSKFLQNCGAASVGEYNKEVWYWQLSSWRKLTSIKSLKADFIGWMKSARWYCGDEGCRFERESFVPEFCGFLNCLDAEKGRNCHMVHGMIREIKCLATGFDLSLSFPTTSWRCARNRSPSRLPLSLMCNFLQVFYEIDDTGGAGAGEVDHFAVIINLAF